MRTGHILAILMMASLVLAVFAAAAGCGGNTSSGVASALRQHPDSLPRSPPRHSLIRQRVRPSSRSSSRFS